MADKEFLLNAKVTVYFEGMIFHTFVEKANIHQAGIHTAMTDHTTTITVKSKGRMKVIAEVANLTAEQIRTHAPFWLYMGTRDQALPLQGTADRSAKGLRQDPNSYDRWLDMEGPEMYPQGLKIKPGIIAPLNIPQGIAYTVNSAPATKREIGTAPKTLLTEEIGTLAAIALPSVADGEYLVLRSARTNTIFINEPLLAGEKYEVIILHTHTTPTDPMQVERHFEELYLAFEEVQPHYIVEFNIGRPPGVTIPEVPPHADPCFDPGLGQHPEGFPW